MGRRKEASRESLVHLEYAAWLILIKPRRFSIAFVSWSPTDGSSLYYIPYTAAAVKGETGRCVR